MLLSEVEVTPNFIFSLFDTDKPTPGGGTRNVPVQSFAPIAHFCLVINFKMTDVEAKEVVETTPPGKEVQGSEDGESHSDDEILKEKLASGKEAMTFEEVVHYHEQFNMREVVIQLPGGGQMRFNPFASLFAIVILWGLTIWCMVDPENSSESIIAWKARVTELFTWFYVGTNPIFMVRSSVWQSHDNIMLYACD
jgi:hypothetical protein